MAQNIVYAPQPYQRTDPYAAGLSSMAAAIKQMYMLKYYEKIEADRAETAAKRRQTEREDTQAHQRQMMVERAQIGGKIRPTQPGEAPTYRTGIPGGQMMIRPGKPGETPDISLGGQGYKIIPRTAATRYQKAPDRMTKVGEKWMRQPQRFNATTGTYEDVGKPYETQTPLKRGWQRKKKVFSGKDGHTYVQEFDYNPSTRERRDVGTAYRAPAGMNIWQFLQQGIPTDMSPDIDLDASVDTEIERLKKEREDLMSQ